jgi:hypothetical protein
MELREFASAAGVRRGMTLTVSSPCPKKWADLVGNDRVRFCGDCKLNVYNLAEMSPAEIEALVRRSSGRLCGQLYVRGDRTATLRDCPTGRSGILRRRLGKAAAGLLVVLFGLAFRFVDRPDTSGWPVWARTVANWIDPDPPSPKPRLRTLGEITCVPPSPPPAR